MYIFILLKSIIGLLYGRLIQGALNRHLPFITQIKKNGKNDID